MLFVNKFEAAYEILSLWYNNESRQAEEWKCLTPVLLEEGGSYYNQSVIGFGYSRQDFYPYVSGYIESAGLLRIKLLESADSMIADVYFLPMCYLYRNAIELVIKSAWFEGVRDSFHKRCKILYNCKHSIIGLWKRLQEWIIGYYNEDDETVKYFDKISKCCEELQSFDSDASRFRYPCTKYMELYNKREYSLDYLNVAEFMESLFTSIDGVSCELSTRNDYLNEMEAEYRSDINGYMF